MSDKHRIERAEDVYPDIEEHLAKPWAMVVRVEGDPIHGDGEPTPTTGEAMVRLFNYDAQVVPEAYDGCAPIYLTIGHPWLEVRERGSSIETLGAIMLEPEHAVALAKGLRTAAERSLPTEELRVDDSAFQATMEVLNMFAIHLTERAWVGVFRNVALMSTEDSGLTNAQRQRALDAAKALQE